MNFIHNLVDTEYCASIIQILSETFQSFKKVEVTSHIFFQSHNYPSHHFKLLLPQFSPKLVWRQICSIFNHLSPSESQKSVCLWRFCLWQKCLWRKMSTFRKNVKMQLCHHLQQVVGGGKIFAQDFVWNMEILFSENCFRLPPLQQLTSSPGEYSWKNYIGICK